MKEISSVNHVMVNCLDLKAMDLLLGDQDYPWIQAGPTRLQESRFYPFIMFIKLTGWPNIICEILLLFTIY
jgi:hypothetical protein